MKPIIFGTRQIGGPPSYNHCDEKKAREVLELAYREGIRTYDTAPIYGHGKSEEILGKVFSSHREDIHIITKFGFNWDNTGNTFFDFSPQGIISQLEKSLERLHSSYIDTYLLHIPEANIDINSIVSTLNSLKKKGYIRSYGVCNTYLKQLQDFISHPESQIEYVEDFYNILEKKAESLIFPYITEKQKFLAYGPLYRGVMTSASIEDLLRKDEDGVNRLIKNRSLPFIYKQKQIYQAIAEKKGIPIEQIALDFLDKNSIVHSIIFGTSKVEHLKSFLEIYRK